MTQKLEKLRQEKNEEVLDYLEFVKVSATDGTYFKDALNWYFFRYVLPICDRTLLIFGALIAAVVAFFLIQMIRSAFPLREQIPVFVKARDQGSVFPNLFPIKKLGYMDKTEGLPTVDEAVIQYLLAKYVVHREEYDFSQADIDKVNTKFTQVRNTSSAEVYRNFQLLMSKDNPSSPIQHFGHNIVRNIYVDSITLEKERAKDFSGKAKNFLLNKLPSKADIRFTAITTISSARMEKTENITERYLARVSFDFDPIGYNDKGRIKFVVRQYDLFRIEDKNPQKP
jgi:type IV secretory pathway component VirB8